MISCYYFDIITYNIYAVGIHPIDRFPGATQPPGEACEVLRCSICEEQQEAKAEVEMKILQMMKKCHKDEMGVS